MDTLLPKFYTFSFGNFNINNHPFLTNQFPAGILSSDAPFAFNLLKFSSVAHFFMLLRDSNDAKAENSISCVAICIICSKI